MFCLISLSHLPATAVRSWTLNIFTKRSEIAEKNVKSMTPCSFIVAHSKLLTRSHCDHLRFRCDSSTLSTHSLRSQCVYNMRTAVALRFPATSSVYFFSFGSCLCAITKINCSHTCLRSWWVEFIYLYTVKKPIQHWSLIFKGPCDSVDVHTNEYKSCIINNETYLVITIIYIRQFNVCLQNSAI